jgi:hypothetical protein
MHADRDITNFQNQESGVVANQLNDFYCKVLLQNLVLINLIVSLDELFFFLENHHSKLIVLHLVQVLQRK